jgi:hypothetical protein
MVGGAGPAAARRQQRLRGRLQTGEGRRPISRARPPSGLDRASRSGRRLPRLVGRLNRVGLARLKAGQGLRIAQDRHGVSQVGGELPRDAQRDAAGF